jgi:hypothetical protein
LRAVLEGRARGAAPGPVTLDLIGHSTRGHRLLRLGRTPVDMLDPAVAGFFRTLAGDGTLTRNAVSAVRLIGCETAVTETGQRTMRMLARVLGLPVFGTVVPLVKSHFGAAGFDPAFSGILTAALPGTPGVIAAGAGCALCSAELAAGPDAGALLTAVLASALPGGD